LAVHVGQDVLLGYATVQAGAADLGQVDAVFLRQAADERRGAYAIGAGCVGALTLTLAHRGGRGKPRTLILHATAEETGAAVFEGRRALRRGRLFV